MTRPKKSSSSPRFPRFQPGDRVRVKYGVADPDFPDIPLGGWAGTIEMTEQVDDQITYEIEWDRRTLDGMHPVYKNRCERDGLDLETMWLGEEDLEADDGTPVPIEQPTAIKTPALAEKDENDRVRAVFGLTHDDLLPEVSEETLLTYYRYLVAKLKFPFAAVYGEEETGPFSRKKRTITVTGLLDPEGYDLDEEFGLIGTGRDRDEAIEFPLDKIEVKKKDPNAKLLSDYSFWFHNWR
jgi:calcium binding protein